MVRRAGQNQSRRALTLLRERVAFLMTVCEYLAKYRPADWKEMLQDLETRVTFFRGCRLVDLPKISDPRGNLTFLEGQRHIDFDIARVYYLYDVPAGEERGGHAHKNLNQLLIPLAGSFDVLLDDGNSKVRVTLNRPFQGLILRPMVWRELDNFSSGAVCLVLASQKYDESDYFRDYAEFVAVAGGKE